MEYKYNADGLRVQKKKGDIVTDYVLSGKNIVHMTVTNGPTMHFYYDAQDRPAQVVYNGVTYRYVHNLQGDIIAIVDAAGNTVVQYTYGAWGEKKSVTGPMATTLGKHNPFRYRGYVWDEETWMYYLRSRYYYPELQRFIGADSMLGSLGSVLSHNIFSYCTNSPTSFYDKNGGRKALSILTLEPFEANDWGTNTSKLPVSLLLKFLTQIAEGEPFKYGSPISYKKNNEGVVDCIGLIVLAAKFWFTSDAFKNTYKVKTGTTSALDNLIGGSRGLKNLDLDKLSEIPVGAVIYQKNRSHVYFYIGYYISPIGEVIPNAVIQANTKDKKNTVRIQSIFDVTDPHSWGQYNYLDYDTTYNDTVPWIVQD